MNLESIQSVLRCPSCFHQEMNIQPGAIPCLRCGKSYPVKDGIARFVPSEDYSASFGFQWNTHSRTQIDKFNGTTISRDRLYRESGWQARELAGKMVLECGSGAGRFTQVLCDSGAQVFSIDYSSAVEANRANNSEAAHLFLSQASIYDLPFRDESFDYLVCLGVIQHTPDVRASVFAMMNKLKPGGKFCFDVYAAPVTWLHPRHLLRPFTRKMDKQKLYELVRLWVPKLLPLSTFLHRVPLIGQLLARLVPIANWRANIKLASEDMYLEWAILDTFDWYSPAYEQPQSRSSLISWAQELKLSEFEVVRERGLYILRGRK